MNDSIQVLKVFKIYTYQATGGILKWWYVGPKRYGSDDQFSKHHHLGKTCVLTENLDYAEDLAAHTIDRLADRYNEIINAMKPGERLEVYDVTRSITHAAAPIDRDLLLERRRLDGLKKLTQSEIQALGLTDYAVYSKLKFHGADDTAFDLNDMPF
jgi:hypothetical protein